MTVPSGRSLQELENIAREIRRLVIRITTEAGSGHPSSSLSAVEVVTALYFGGYLRHFRENPRAPHRDRFILSKGHAVPVLYAALCQAGYYSVDEIMTLRKLGSPFEGHPNMKRLETIEASTGSLGQGLSLGVGHALAARMDGLDAHTYVMLGDGEMGEGQVWEAIASAYKYRLSNVTAIVDQNGYQQTGATKDVLDLTPFAPKFAAFGWHVQTINGNSLPEVLSALKAAREVHDRPTAIVAQTRKGFGILPVLEATGDPNYHGKPLSRELAEKALALLA
ncbi:MAG: transketolase [Planctomycetaceae bacterium]|nr:MAG: transketolase [Planctomycetaceae bacterium]